MLKQAIRYVGIRGISSRPRKTPGVDKFLPREPPKPQKEWEKRGISKHEFFANKYSFMSDDRKQRLQKKIDRESRAKMHKRENRKTKEQEEQSSRRIRSQKDPQGEAPSKPERPSFFDNALTENVYGRHAVLSALKSKKRLLYERLWYLDKSKMSEILSLCKKYGIHTEAVPSRQKLDTLTNRGVHNGVVLAARKLELPTIASLGTTEPQDGTYSLQVWNEFYNAQVKVSKPIISKLKNPLGIFLDEITDPQNVGAIIRSAYFLGVDFIVTPSHNSARLGPVAAKAAAGTLDLMDIYQVDRSLKFIREVAQSDWALVTTEVKDSSKMVDQNMLSDILAESPVLLVLGSEGSGVRTNIRNLSDFYVKLSKARTQDNIVDSLNVSAAASVLISRFLL